MIDLLILHLTLAFAVGGAWVSSATLIAERCGSRLGGLVGGLPAISIFSFLFIGLNQSGETASEATVVFPLAPQLYHDLPPRLRNCFEARLSGRVSRSPARLGHSLGNNGIPQLEKPIFLSWSLSTSATFIFYVLKVRMKLPPVGGAMIYQSLRQVAFRAIVGGGIIAFAVLSSQLGGPELGGIASSFSAIFSLTLFFTYRTRGILFSRALTKPLLISGGLTAFPYSLLVGYLYPILGVEIRTIAALLCLVPLIVLGHFLINVRKI